MLDQLSSLFISLLSSSPVVSEWLAGACNERGAMLIVWWDGKLSIVVDRDILPMTGWAIVDMEGSARANRRSDLSWWVESMAAATAQDIAQSKRSLGLTLLGR